MRFQNRFALLLVAGLVVLGSISPSALGQAIKLECPQMGVVVTLPDGWKPGDAKAVPQVAVSADGSAKLALLYFEKQYLFEVLSDEKLAANFAPALKDAKLTDSEKAVINTLVGAKATGTGTLDGKPVQFKCVIAGDKDNKPNTLVVIVVASADAMKQHAKEIAAALDSVRPADAKKD